MPTIKLTLFVQLSLLEKEAVLVPPKLCDLIDTHADVNLLFLVCLNGLKLRQKHLIDICLRHEAILRGTRIDYFWEVQMEGKFDLTLVYRESNVQSTNNLVNIILPISIWSKNSSVQKIWQLLAFQRNPSIVHGRRLSAQGVKHGSHGKTLSKL